MNRNDKIKALQQALRGNLDPLTATDENVIVGVVVAHKGIFQIVDLHPSINATEAPTLQELKSLIPLFV
jgi:pyrimidine deaminase RibD-like protein